MAILKKNRLVGLDIGSHSIKLVEIDHSKREKSLKNFGVITLPHNAVMEGNIKDEDSVVSAIMALYDNLKIKNRKVATSISGFSVIAKKIALGLDHQDESEIENAIRSEAEQYIPFDIDEVNLDFDIVGSEYDSDAYGDDNAKEGPDRIEVMVVAAKRQIVEDYVILLEKAGLVPSIIDIDVFALQNAFEISEAEYLEAENLKSCIALVDIGAEQITMNVLKNNIPFFTRDSSFGGMQITNLIMSEFDVDYETAEKIKLGATDIEDTERLEKIVSSVVSEWVLEIKRNLDFVRTTYRDETIGKILMSGGACRLPGFQEYLQQETEIPVFEFNPFSGLMLNKNKFDQEYLNYMAPQSAVAVGLALRSIGDK